MDKLLELEIVSPVRNFYHGFVTSVTAPGVLGEFQVLYNHTALVSTLEIGIIKIKDDKNTELRFSTSGGILEVKNNKITVLAETIENIEDIDVERANKSIERAKKRMDENTKDFDRARAMLSIKRANNRLKVVQS